MTYAIGLIGATGRMGQSIISCIEKDPSFSLSWKLSSEDSRNALPRVDAIIDFSSVKSLESNLALAKKMQIPIVIGTTGLQEEEKHALKMAALELPIFWASNFSLGMAILIHAVKTLSPLLEGKFKPFIYETHHAHKKDSPSGSALSIAEAARTAYKDTPPIQSFRKGEVIGDHSICFIANDEKFTMQHESVSRDVFALGALQAAKFLINKPAKLYQMQDLLETS